MKNSETKILLIGIGNNGRADDGLGWAFLEDIENALPKNWETEYRYQLQIEDAELISKFDKVYFVDSDRRKYINGYDCLSLKSEAGVEYTSHQLDPKVVLHLCETMYHKFPEAYVLGISGYDFQLRNGLSFSACENLDKATSFFKDEVVKRVG